MKLSGLGVGQVHPSWHIRSDLAYAPSVHVHAGKLEGWHEYIVDIQLVYEHGEQVVEWLSFGG